MGKVAEIRPGISYIKKPENIKALLNRRIRLEQITIIETNTRKAEIYQARLFEMEGILTALGVDF